MSTTMPERLCQHELRRVSYGHYVCKLCGRVGCKQPSGTIKWQSPAVGKALLRFHTRMKMLKAKEN